MYGASLSIPGAAGAAGITVSTGGLLMAGQASLLPWLALAAVMLFTAPLVLRSALRRQKRLATQE